MDLFSAAAVPYHQIWHLGLTLLSKLHPCLRHCVDVQQQSNKNVNYACRHIPNVTRTRTRTRTVNPHYISAVCGTDLVTDASLHQNNGHCETNHSKSQLLDAVWWFGQGSDWRLDFVYFKSWKKMLKLHLNPVIIPAICEEKRESLLHLLGCSHSEGQYFFIIV